MKTLEQGQEKIQKICDKLKTEIIEPAKKEAETIIAEAKARAHQIVKEAEKQAADTLKDVKTDIEQERHVFQSAMKQSARLTVESLKQEIQQKFFNQEFYLLVEKSSSDPQLIVRLLEAIIKAIEKDGLSANFSALVPKTISQKEVNALLGEHLLKKLKEQSVVLGDFAGGAQVKLHDKKLTIDISDKALIELLANFAPGFRKAIYTA